jgi:hypothetical protein
VEGLRRVVARKHEPTKPFRAPRARSNSRPFSRARLLVHAGRRRPLHEDREWLVVPARRRVLQQQLPLARRGLLPRRQAHAAALPRRRPRMFARKPLLQRRLREQPVCRKPAERRLEHGTRQRRGRRLVQRPRCGMRLGTRLLLGRLRERSVFGQRRWREWQSARMHGHDRRVQPARRMLQQFVRRPKVQVGVASGCPKPLGQAHAQPWCRGVRRRRGQHRPGHDRPLRQRDHRSGALTKGRRGMTRGKPEAKRGFDQGSLRGTSTE